MDIHLNPRFVEIKKGKHIVILTEEEWDQILDVLDVFEAERIEQDESDPLLKWDDVHGSLIRNRIREVRKARGTTRKELARRLKVTPPTVRRMESEDARHGPEKLTKVARALGCSLDDLI